MFSASFAVGFCPGPKNPPVVNDGTYVLGISSRDFWNANWTALHLKSSEILDSWTKRSKFAHQMDIIDKDRAVNATPNGGKTAGNEPAVILFL